MNITSKQRSILKGYAMKLEPVFQIGKDSVSPELTKGIREVLEKRELIKIHVLRNCTDDKKEMAQMLAERTQSVVVQVIGSMIVLFKYQTDPEKRKIEI